jgi:hypothetical protein
LPRPANRSAPLFGLAPDGVCRAKPVTRPAGELLPRRFTLTPIVTASATSGAVCFLWHFPYPSHALRSQTVGVTHHRALRSPDFPPWHDLGPRAVDRFPGSTPQVQAPRRSSRPPRTLSDHTHKSRPQQPAFHSRYSPTLARVRERILANARMRLNRPPP